MTASELGRKLKEARLAKRMTQAEVVGDFITRNMLSQIESGAAMPSVRTLSYLARVLDLPTEQLIAGDGASEDAFRILLDAKAAYRAGDFAAVPCDATAFPDEVSDELYALAARACLIRARSEAGVQAPSDVTTLIRRAIDFSGKGLYANEALRSEAVLFLNEQVGRLRDYYKALAEE